MSGNNPASTVTVVVEDDLIVLSHNGPQCYEKGTKATIQKSTYRLCQETIVPAPAEGCPDIVGLITLLPDEYTPVDVPNAGTTDQLCIKSEGAFLYSLGTASKPASKPDPADPIEENAPTMVYGNQNTVINLLDDPEDPVNQICIFSCSQEPNKIQVTWKGC